MPEEQSQAVITLLTNLTRDVGQIKTDLAVNTTKTGYIEEHLRTLNGKVIKQEERQQNADKERAALTNTVTSLVNTKRRWNDGWFGLLKEIGIFLLGLLSAYIINRFFH